MLWLAVGSSAAHAQQDTYGARAKVKAPVASTHTDDATASGTAIDVRDRSSALEGTDEVIAGTPGARVRRSGAFGSFSGVSLRGAGVEHTTVLFDALPLNTADTGAFDLSLVPLSVLDSIEIYRGGAPIWWSDGAIGGVVRLVPRSAEGSSLSAQTGFGSFGRFELGVTSAVVHGSGAHPAFFTHVDVDRADNDYAYVDDNQTRFDTANASAERDDVTRHQQNAQVTAADGLAHAGVDLASGRLDVVLLAHERSEGIPGPLAAPTQQAHRQLTRGLGAVSWTKERLRSDGERDYRFQVLASGNLQAVRVADVEHELGLSRSASANDTWSRGFARVASSFALAPMLEPTFVASVARDDYRPEDALAFVAPPRPSGRTSEALAAELRLHGALGDTRLELRPSVRAQWSQTSIWVTGDTPADSQRDRRAEVAPTYRIAALVAPWPAIAFSASASTGARLPSVVELFGDRVSQEPNMDLRAEHSRSVDASTAVRGQSGDLRGSAELRGFALFIDDMIAYRRTSQYTVTPQNIDTARVLGLELGTQGAYGRHLALAGSATVMQTRNQFDKSLPLRPPLQLYLRPEVSFFPEPFDRVTVFVEAEHVSFVYVDPANLTFLPGRTEFSLGTALRFWRERATLAARAQNVFGVAATDVLSHPLPGFNFLLSLTVTEASE